MPSPLSVPRIVKCYLQCLQPNFFVKIKQTPLKFGNYVHVAVGTDVKFLGFQKPTRKPLHPHPRSLATAPASPP